MTGEILADENNYSPDAVRYAPQWVFPAGRPASGEFGEDNSGNRKCLNRLLHSLYGSSYIGSIRRISPLRKRGEKSGASDLQSMRSKSSLAVKPKRIVLLRRSRPSSQPTAASPSTPPEFAVQHIGQRDLRLQNLHRKQTPFVRCSDSCCVCRRQAVFS